MLRRTNQRHIFWQRLDSPGFEHVWYYQQALEYDGELIINRTAQGLMVGTDTKGKPFRFEYYVYTTQENLHEVKAWDLMGRRKRQRYFHVGRVGNWDCWDDHFDELDGCFYVDIAGSPISRTLPIRRLGLQVGESKEIDVVQISVPELTYQRIQQRYTYLAQEKKTGYWLFEQDDFQNKFAVDANGLVINCEGLFKRIWAK